RSLFRFVVHPPAHTPLPAFVVRFFRTSHGSHTTFRIRCSIFSYTARHTHHFPLSMFDFFVHRTAHTPLSSFDVRFFRTPHAPDATFRTRCSIFSYIETFEHLTDTYRTITTTQKHKNPYPYNSMNRSSY